MRLVGSDGTIHGCVAATGALSVVPPGTACPAGTAALNWSQAFTGRYTSPGGTSSLSKFAPVGGGTAFGTIGAAPAGVSLCR